jgi:hypothetical protein
MEGIFYTIQDELTGRFVVIDEIEGSIWAYLTFPYENRINKDCFLGSRKEIYIEEFNLAKYKEKQSPPPMIKEFSTSKSWLPNLTVDEITIEWESENSIVKIKGEPFLYFTKIDKKGFSKAISKNGMYGNKWNQNKYDEIFK